MKIVTVLGARPQFIKAAMLSKEFSEHPDIEEAIVHTGQHFDANMSDIFFNQMGIKQPAYNLEINGLQHGAMTGKMLEKIETVLLKEKPEWVLVYGDTNSTLAGALAAKKLGIKVAHVEAGLRSFNMQMPEEINRVLTDRISDLLLCPTASAVNNLKSEGFENLEAKIVKTGDVMQDAAIYYKELATKPDGDIPSEFILCTIHRAENTNNIEKLKEVLMALNHLSNTLPVVMPLHPRTKKVLEENYIEYAFTVLEPVGYLEMLYLLRTCKFVITDSGGLQKEAFFMQKPCLTVREETEWVELVDNGYNVLVGTNEKDIFNAVENIEKMNRDYHVDMYGNGRASKLIVKELIQ